MITKSVKINYGFSYPEIQGICLEKANFAIRDKEQFANFGISEDSINTMRTRAEEFTDAQFDQTMRNATMAATQRKNELMLQIRKMISDISLRAKLTFGEKSIAYARFRYPNLSRYGALKLALTTGQVIQAATEKLADLSLAGQTEAHLTELNALRTELYAIVEEQKSAIAERDIATRNRRKTADELYSMLSTVCEVGKQIWKHTDEARYNDYILFGQRTGTETSDSSEDNESESLSVAA